MWIINAIHNDIKINTSNTSTLSITRLETTHQPTPTYWIMLYKWTLEYHHSPSCYFEKSKVKINVVYDVTLSKENIDADNIAKVWDVWHQTILSPSAFKGGKDAGSCFPLSNEPQLLNEIGMSTFLTSLEIGIHRE